MKRLSSMMLSGVLALCCLANKTWAQSFADKPIKIIVPFSAGGGTDIIARLIGSRLTEKWGQSVIVENRTGANGNIGAQAVAKAVPDGHTLLVSTSALTINLALNENSGYQLKDLTPITLLASSPYLLVVNPAVAPVNNLRELIALSNTNQGNLSWASTSEGNAEHLAGSLLQRMANFRMNHIPYKGGADALKDVLGGHVGVGVISLPTALPYVASGQLRVLGVTSSRRAAQLPDAPTLAEVGVAGYELPTWYGVWAPSGIKPEMLIKLHESIGEVLRSEEVKRRVISIGFEPGATTQADFADYVRREAEKYTNLVIQLGMRKQ